MKVKFDITENDMTEFYTTETSTRGYNKNRKKETGIT